MLISSANISTTDYIKSAAVAKPTLFPQNGTLVLSEIILLRAEWKGKVADDFYFCSRNYQDNDYGSKGFVFQDSHP